MSLTLADLSCTRLTHTRLVNEALYPFCRENSDAVMKTRRTAASRKLPIDTRRAQNQNRAKNPSYKSRISAVCIFLLSKKISISGKCFRNRWKVLKSLLPGCCIFRIMRHLLSRRIEKHKITYFTFLENYYLFTFFTNQNIKERNNISVAVFYF